MERFVNELMNQDKDLENKRLRSQLHAYKGMVETLLLKTNRQKIDAIDEVYTTQNNISPLGGRQLGTSLENLDEIDRMVLLQSRAQR